jgi:hypothetical protein
MLIVLSNESGCSLHLRMFEGRCKICQFSLGRADFPICSTSPQLDSRVRQLNAQVIDCYEPEFKNVYYNRESCCG